VGQVCLPSVGIGGQQIPCRWSIQERARLSWSMFGISVSRSNWIWEAAATLSFYGTLEFAGRVRPPIPNTTLKGEEGRVLKPRSMTPRVHHKRIETVTL
jgi:hypothetical protein